MLGAAIDAQTSAEQAASAEDHSLLKDVLTQLESVAATTSTAVTQLASIDAKPAPVSGAAWAGGTAFNHPERHCVVCGKKCWHPSAKQRERRQEGGQRVSATKAIKIQLK